MFSGSRKTSMTTPTPLPKTHSMLVVSSPTTTDSATQWFSPSYWRKRNVSQPPSPRYRSSENAPARCSSYIYSLDKALPATPSGEGRDPGESEIPQQTTCHFPTSQVSKAAEVQSATRSTVPLLRGPCVSLASASPSVETNRTSPGTPSNARHLSIFPISSNSSAQIRRTKSANRLRASDSVTNEKPVDRRRRGLSFGAPNLLENQYDTTRNGQESESMPISSKPLPKSLSRRPSFWSKKKSPSPTKPTAQNGTPSIIPPLPLVDMTPFAPQFTSEPFQLSPSSTTIASPSQTLQSNSIPKGATPVSTTSSTTSFEVVNGYTRPNQDAYCHPSRGSTSPPLLHRLSFGVFSSPETSPVIRPNFLNQSLSHSATIPFPSKSNTQIPPPATDSESPENYVLRLMTHISKAEIASVLASSSELFYSRALEAYLNGLDFSGIPLDIALRKLLMQVGLPRETQQIDRVMEAFASRYGQCNPNPFTSEDHTYILAFSLIMLHTDAFNPSNKRKMTKADYIKNTKLPGISTEILDYFFDNIVFAPFIFIEDSEDVNASYNSTTDLASSVSTSTSVASAGLATQFKTMNKVDPYYLIMNDLLDPLRVDVESYIPLSSPFTCEDENGILDEVHLRKMCQKPQVIELEIPLALRSFPTLGLSKSPTVSSDMSQEIRRLKAIKAGVLDKKDDLAEGGKKNLNRKWKTWGVILSGSHLMFSRDTTRSTLSTETGQQANSVGNIKFRPDEIYSLKDCIAVYDQSYAKYSHTFRLVLPDGRHLLIRARDEKQLQEWIASINYASAFRSSGVRMQPASDRGIHLDCAYTPKSPLRIKTNDQRRQSDVNDLHVHPATDGRKGEVVETKLSSMTPNLLAVQVGDYISESPSHRSLNREIGSPRFQFILKKIHELDDKITALRAGLESDERLARNIAILTPFRKTTRSRLSTVVQNLAKPLMRKRLEMEKLKCYRRTLVGDVFLERPRSASDVPRRPKTAPSIMFQPHTSFDWPFHPASSLDSSPELDFHHPEGLKASSDLVLPIEPEEDTRSESSSQRQNNIKDRIVRPCRDSSFESGSQGDEDVQAEEWNKTRVANRVSLIHIPSDFTISMRLKAVLNQ